MTLADVNFWLALTLSRHVFHRSATEWLAGQSETASVLFCRATQQSFLRLLTTEAVLRPYGIPPMTNAEAWRVYDGLLADARIGWAGETDTAAVESQWKRLATVSGQASPKLWMDAYLAAVALSDGHGLVTTDKVFRQFQPLRVILLS